MLIGLGETLAYFGGNKLKITLDEHQIDIDVVNPLDVEDVAYDTNHYVNGNIFIDGYSNPVKHKFDEAEEEVELVSSMRYKPYMNNKLLEDLIKSTEGRKGDALFMMMAVASIGSFAILLLLMFMMIG